MATRATVLAAAPPIPGHPWSRPTRFDRPSADLAGLALEWLPDAVLLVDAGGQLLVANEAARRLIARKGNGPARMFIGGRRRQVCMLPPVRSALTGRGVSGVELRLGPTGEVVVQATATPLRGGEGAVWGALLTLQDVTALRAVAHQKEEFMADVSHELRTPLAAIQASLGVLLDRPPTELDRPFRRLLENADEAAERMRALVENLLDLARAHAGVIHLTFASTDLVELAEEAARTISPLAAIRSQRVAVRAPRRSVRAVVDRARIRQALLNLLSNAQKHGIRGGLIRVDVERAGETAVLTVTDDGPGIPDEERERVFERFHRVHAGPGRAPGSGLGLPIARALVELHGGRLELVSPAGTGAVFRMTLPARRRRSRPKEVPA